MPGEGRQRLSCGGVPRNERLSARHNQKRLIFFGRRHTYASASGAIQRLLRVAFAEIDFGLSDRLLLKRARYNRERWFIFANIRQVADGADPVIAEARAKSSRQLAGSRRELQNCTGSGRRSGRTITGAPVARAVRFSVHAICQRGVMVEAHAHRAGPGWRIA